MRKGEEPAQDGRKTIRIAVFLIGLALSNPVQAVTPNPAIEEGDDSLRAQALAFNNITGEKAITSKIRELLKDKPALRKLLAEAVSMAKEKEDPPFNYTGAWILARTAHVLGDYDSGETFYKICIERAAKLESSEKTSAV